MSEYISIDPGMKGAITYFKDLKVVDVWDIPSISFCGKREIVDLEYFNRILNNIRPAKIFVELVGPGPRDGVASAGKFMFNYGTLMAVVLQFPHKLILPQHWKAYAGLIGKVKKASVGKAIMKYPEAEKFLTSKFANNIDRADSILIGHYGIFKYGDNE